MNIILSKDKRGTEKNVRSKRSRIVCCCLPRFSGEHNFKNDIFYKFTWTEIKISSSKETLSDLRYEIKFSSPNPISMKHYEPKNLTMVR